MVYVVLRSPEAEADEDVLVSCLEAIRSLSARNADNQTRFGELGACVGT